TEDKLLFLGNYGFLFYLFFMVFHIIILIQLERTLSGLPQYERWRVKLEIIGVGFLLSALLVYFSQAFLYRSLDVGLLPVRVVALYVALGFIFYSRMFRSRDTQVRVSQEAAYRSVVLFAVGFYLLGVGLLGEGMRYVDLPHQRTVLILIGMFSGILAILLFFSESTRRKIKVILQKNFYREKYEYREQWLAFNERLTSTISIEQLQDAILCHFCETIGCQSAALYLYDHEQNDYHHAASFEFRRDWRSFPLGDPLIFCLQEKEWIVDLNDDQPELRLSLISSFIDVGSRFVVPLFFNTHLEGFIILGSLINKNDNLTYEDFDLMRLLGRQGISAIKGIRLTEQLSTARELAAIGKVTTFVLHDLKNQVSGLSLLLDNSREHISDPEFQQDMLEAVGNTVENMQGLIARLKNIKGKSKLAIVSVVLSKIVVDAVKTAGGKTEVSGEEIQVVVDDEEIYKVILNLLLNATEATTSQEPVRVSYGQKNGFAFVEVNDSGCGMNADFIENKLFKPFETTKKHGLGIGLYQCKQIIESHGGSIEVESCEGEGTTFVLLLPLDNPSS
ncbi:PEP-CTERM system histidine kinase PrsK, partial [bacterium]|nr:PEP-CTERM system histidine kinase PrsK [bacterium]